MQFVKNKNSYKVIRITGPSHNLLSLTFCKNKIDSIELIGINDKELESHNTNYADIKNQVLLGLQMVNAEFGLNYQINKIEFMTTDTPSSKIYSELTVEIIKRIIAKKPFQEI